MDGSVGQRPILFGEVLFDRFPEGSVVMGGAPFNVAWHLQAFGLSPLLVSRIGSDALGRLISTSMINWGMDRSGLQLDSAHPTGTVEVTFSEEEPLFDIVNNRAFDYIDRFALPPICTGGPLYFGSLALRNQISRDALLELKQCSAGSCFVDVNLRSPWWSFEQVMLLLKEAWTIKLNHFELQELVPGEMDLESRAEKLLTDMNARQLVVTLGREGAFALMQNGDRYRVKPALVRSVVDTVGAGDAFSAVLLLGQWRGWELGLTLERAQEFASAIVGIRGSIVRDLGFYQGFLDSWVNIYTKNESAVVSGIGDLERIETCG